MSSSFLYTAALAGFGNGLLGDWSAAGGSFYVTLVSNNYVPSEGHSYASNFSGAELSSASHTGGYGGTIRVSMTGRTVFSNTTSHQAEFRASPVSYVGISAGTAHAFIVLKQAGSDGNSPLVAYVSTGGWPLVTNNGNVTISFANSGVFQAQKV